MTENKVKSKLLIVNDNMNIGGIQKSLLNFLTACHSEYDITLMLLNSSGAYLELIPSDVKVISSSGALRAFGASKAELKSKPLSFAWKGVLKTMMRFFGKAFMLKFALIFQKPISGYDFAISFSHPSKDGLMRSCGAELVLKKVCDAEKICYLHGDYTDNDVSDAYTDLLFSSFDKIACCSESVRAKFLSRMPSLEGKAYTARNFYDLSIVKSHHTEGIFDSDYINVISVARLSTEKGLDRAIKALANSKRGDIKYYIIGWGPQENLLKELIVSLKLQDRVFLLGEMKHPYKHMFAADYLLVPSYHEASPIVFDEAKCLGLKVITTETVSAKEMITEKYGIVCENSENGLKGAFESLKKPKSKNHEEQDNSLQLKQFADMIHSR